jgi:predicted DNA-binding transcriptional regulator YafY
LFHHFGTAGREQVKLFQSRHHLSASQFQKILEISPATFKRDLSILRDRFEFPIVYDRDILAYRLDRTTFKKQLPGVWFSSEEIALIRVLSNRLNLDNDMDCTHTYKSIIQKIERLCL